MDHTVKFTFTEKPKEVCEVKDILELPIIQRKAMKDSNRRKRNKGR